MSNENYNNTKIYNQEFEKIIKNTNLTPLTKENLRNITPTDENFKANLFKLYKAYEKYIKNYPEYSQKMYEQHYYEEMKEFFIYTYRFKVKSGEIIKNFFIKYGSIEKKSPQRTNVYQEQRINVYRFIQQFSHTDLLSGEYSFRSIMNLTPSRLEHEKKKKEIEELQIKYKKLVDETYTNLQTKRPINNNKKIINNFTKSKQNIFSQINNLNKKKYTEKGSSANYKKNEYIIKRMKYIKSLNYLNEENVKNIKEKCVLKLKKEDKSIKTSPHYINGQITTNTEDYRKCKNNHQGRTKLISKKKTEETKGFLINTNSSSVLLPQGGKKSKNTKSSTPSTSRTSRTSSLKGGKKSKTTKTTKVINKNNQKRKCIKK
jgi:hypothetical protein